MKRVIAIILTMLYAFLSLGLVLHVHFCGDKLADISIIKEIDSCCADHATDCCAVRVNCCENLELRLTIDEVHQSSSGIELPDFIPAILGKFEHKTGHVSSLEDRLLISSRGSPVPDNPLYLKYCRLTYYG